MRITVSGTIRKDLHPEVRRLVEFGFRGTNSSGVEVHVKGRKPLVRWSVTYPDGSRFGSRKKAYLEHHAKAGQTIVRHETIDSGYSGRAYCGVPSIANVGPGTTYLVTLTIPANPEAISYPKPSWSRYKRAPVVELRSWREEFVHLVAHEANHIRQYRTNAPRSEVKCERWAAKLVEALRGAS